MGGRFLVTKEKEKRARGLGVVFLSRELFSPYGKNIVVPPRW